MINLINLFWILVAFFALMGAIRGWAKEIVVTAGQILSLFILQQFAWLGFSTIGLGTDPTVPDQGILQQQFWVLTILHLIITFFSYEGPSLTGFRRDKLSAKDNLQERLLGGVLGAVNGYLLFGTLLSFLEYRVSQGGWARLADGVGYAFDPAVISRPLAPYSEMLLNYLPVAVTGGLVLPLVMVVLFLIVLIVLI